MDVDAFDFALPAELIAQEPLPARDASRLLYLPRPAGSLEHRKVSELPQLLRPGDLLIANDARVVPARLSGRKRGSGGKVELLLIEPLASALPASPASGENEWLALGQSNKPMRAGQIIDIDVSGTLAPAGAQGSSSGDASPDGYAIEIVEVRGGGELRVRMPPALANDDAVFAFLERAGALPLPPYIERAPREADRDRYQTLFARVPGAVAAPTAGLHFTSKLLADLDARGVERAFVTLHVGPGTFLPVRAARTEDHRMHRERFHLPPETAAAFARARERKGRIVAVGTTALRTLEAAWEGREDGRETGPNDGPYSTGRLRIGPGSTDLFCTPGYRFRAVDALFTNFHLPKSTLFMLVAAFAGLEEIRAAYRAAIAERYRFFSYGDAMLIDAC